MTHALIYFNKDKAPLQTFSKFFFLEISQFNYQSPYMRDTHIVCSSEQIKNQQYCFISIYLQLMYLMYTIFQHSFYHCWGTCHSRAPDCVFLHCRKLLPLWCKPHVMAVFFFLLMPLSLSKYHQGIFYDTGTNENHLALGLGYKCDDQIVPRQI